MANKSGEEARRADEQAAWASPDMEGVTPAMADVDQQTAPEDGAPVSAIEDVTKGKVSSTVEGAEASDMVAKVIQFENEVLDEATREAEPDPKKLGKVLEARAKAMVQLIGKNAEKKQRVEDFWNRAGVRLKEAGKGVGSFLAGIGGPILNKTWKGVCAAIPTGIQAWRRAWRGGNKKLDKHD
ncbi:hypothetical protein ACFL3C_02855 [Patescibacteria group bacterium]